MHCFYGQVAGIVVIRRNTGGRISGDPLCKGKVAFNYCGLGKWPMLCVALKVHFQDSQVWAAAQERNRGSCAVGNAL